MAQKRKRNGSVQTVRTCKIKRRRHRKRLETDMEDDWEGFTDALLKKGSEDQMDWATLEDPSSQWLLCLDTSNSSCTALIAIYSLKQMRFWVQSGKLPEEPFEQGSVPSETAVSIGWSASGVLRVTGEMTQLKKLWLLGEEDDIEREQRLTWSKDMEITLEHTLDCEAALTSAFQTPCLQQLLPIDDLVDLVVEFVGTLESLLAYVPWQHTEHGPVMTGTI
jgi:hypothetical protein